MAGFPLWILAVAVGITRVMTNVILSNPEELVLDTETPPHVTEPNRQTTIYVAQGEAVKPLRCKATGNPADLTMEWLVDGALLTSTESRIQLLPDNGTLLITDFRVRLEGYYQCRARNGHGVSLSQIIELRERVLPVFINEEKPDNKFDVDEGHGIKLECTDQPYSRPLGPYSWYHVIDKKDNLPINVKASDRMDIDRNGSLYIIEARPEDAAKTYACAMASSGTGSSIAIAKTPYVALQVTEGPIQEFKPELLGSTGHITAELHRSVTLECFFSGQPRPKITWLYGTRRTKVVNGTEKRIFISPLGHKLQIKALTDDDQEDYICEAVNTQGKASATNSLRITSRPLFKKRPEIIVSPVGSDATFHCVAQGALEDTPPSPPRWTINGNPPHSKYRISEDGTQLTVRGVTKSDMMCIQCNVTNTQGYAFGDGYLVVIDPLRIVNQPNRTIAITPGTQEVNLTVAASSDACCPVIFLWSLNGTFLTKSTLRTPPYGYYPGHNQATLTIQLPANGTEADGQPVLGEYRCVVRHDAYNESRVVTVTLRMKEVKEPATEKGTETKEAGVNYWWIGLAGGIIILLLAVIGIVLMVHFNYPRQAYLLDKEERKHRLDPQKDILDHSFEEI